MVEPSSLPVPLQQALMYLCQDRSCHPRVDAVCNNFAYIWIPDMQKSTTDQETGGWIRLSTAFPFGNPHGLVTIEALKRIDGTLVTDGHNPGHEMCEPVKALGGANYYSWTWQDCPAIEQSKDIIGVVHWYERRVRRA